MSHYPDEEFDRKKSSLVRPKVENIPHVPEESYSVKSYSPLPELQIERIPDRHDEPEESYQQLEIKMRKLYKKMFKTKQDADSEEKNEVNTFRIQSPDRTNTNSDQTDLSNNEDYNIKNELNKSYSSPSPVGLITNSTQADSTLDNDDEPITNRFDNVSYEYNIASPSKTDSVSRGDISVTNIESDKSDDDENGQTSQYALQQALETVEDINKIDKDVRYHYNSKRLSIILEESDNSRLEMNTEDSKRHAHKSRDLDDSTEASNHATSPTAALLSFEKNELEVMRGKAKISSESFTVLPENDSILNKSFIARDISFDIDHEEADRSEEFQVLQFNTPKISNEPDSNCTTENSRKRHSNGEGCDVLIKKHKIDNAAQTDDENVTWNTLKRFFFIGVPKMYNLCSCKYHKCNP